MGGVSVRRAEICWLSPTRTGQAVSLKPNRKSQRALPDHNANSWTLVLAPDKYVHFKYSSGVPRMSDL